MVEASKVFLFFRMNRIPLNEAINNRIVPKTRIDTCKTETFRNAPFRDHTIQVGVECNIDLTIKRRVALKMDEPVIIE